MLDDTYLEIINALVGLNKSNNAIKSVNYDSNIEQLVLDLISHHGTDELFNNSQNFLNKYMENRGNAAKKLIDSIEDLMIKN